MRAGTLNFDLIIVGGSFAGLACARTAALRGLKVALIDAKPDPGARVRTTGIVVKEAADAFDLPSTAMRRVPGVRLYAPNGRSIDLHAPGYAFHTTDTAALMWWMADEAAHAGAQLFYGMRFEGAESDGSHVVLPSLGLRARHLVGADGARSRIAKAFGLGRNRRFLTGVEIEVEAFDGLDGRFLHCFADSRLAPGYLAWVAPGVGVTQIGLAVRHGDRPDLKPLLERVRTLWGADRLRVVERRSGLIPAGGRVSKVGSRNVVLVGDAAGLVSPLTGGGIHLALQSGRRAAQVIADHLLMGGAVPSAVLAREYPGFALKLMLRRALDLAPPNALIDAALFTSPVRALAQRLYFHRRAGAHEDFLAWREEFESGRARPPARRPGELSSF